MSRRICIVTGSRAEYGLLYWLMKDVQAAPDLTLQVVASAMHLAPEFGRTVDQIRADGFTVDAEVHMLVAGDCPLAIAKSQGLGIIGFADAFARLQPDAIVLLGDRFEALAAATAATTLRIPIVHLHGGETSEGAIDEAYRHAITKMAHLHCVAAPAYGRRVIQMGEQPDRVHVVGAPGLDTFLRLELPERAALCADVGLDPARPLFVITYHPATLADASPLPALEELLAALHACPDASLLITKANADAGGQAINQRLERFAAEEGERAVLVSSLGQRRYLAALKAAALVIGNSSSGLIEAPAADVPTINLGSRQAGRLKGASVLDCAEERTAILAAIAAAQSTDFRARMAASTPPYGRPADTARTICALLHSVPLGENLLIKRFHDLPEQP